MAASPEKFGDKTASGRASTKMTTPYGTERGGTFDRDTTQDEQMFTGAQTTPLADTLYTADSDVLVIPDTGLSGADDEETAYGGERDSELMAEGVLDEEAVGEGLSKLGRSADGTVQVFLHLNLVGLALKDISILENYVHLQRVEIPHNNINDLSALSHMPYLLELDASHNEITDLLDFKPPKNLKRADFSHNHLTEMTDLSAHHYLSHLILDHNEITEIKGIQDCHRLEHLSLAFNKISTVYGIDHLPIKNLDLSHNLLIRIENIAHLQYLQTINVSGNQIRSLEGLEEHHFLERIDLEGNEVIDMVELDYIRELQMLRYLNLQRNPIRELPDYRLSVLFHLPKLTELDNRKANVEEKVAATNMFNPPLEVIAARDHIMHVVYSFLQPSVIYDSTLPNIETPYPMLVLVGPSGAGKKDLALRLVEEFPDYFGYAMLHTTHAPIPSKDDVQDHFQHISLPEFERDIKMGKFVLTYAYMGELFGLHMDAIEAVAREGLACVVHMELEGVLTLKNTYFEPRYVLMLPLEPTAHERRLRERDLYNDVQIDRTLQRAEMYSEYNRQHPGFFDMMIPTDDIVEAYRKLRRLVMDYLGMSHDTPSLSELDTGNTESAMGGGLDREQTTDTIVPPHGGGSQSANMQRTWSKHSLPSESLSAALLANVRATATAGLKDRGLVSGGGGGGRGIVDSPPFKQATNDIYNWLEANQSMKRREGAARDAVTGMAPNIYDQITRDTPRTVPASTAAQMGLGESAPPTQRNNPTSRAYSAPQHNDNMDVLPPNSPDSSDMGLQDDASSLSNLSEAREVADTRMHSPAGSTGRQRFSPPTVRSPVEKIDRLELGSNMSSGKASGASPNSVPPTPRPGGSASQQGSRMSAGRPGSGPGSRVGSGRPGSDRHPVLPPISPAPVNPLPAF